MSEHPIEGLMLTAMNSIQDMVDVNTIIGEPIETSNNMVIIPISKVGFGFAAGGSEFKGETLDEYTKKEKEEQVQYRLPFGGGSGAGVSISPVAFLVVSPNNVKLLPVSHSSAIDRLNQGGGGGSSSSSGNAINSSNTSNGKISISPARAEEGDTVTITVTPDTGYQLDQLTVTDADGNTIRTNNQGDGKYTFTMPDSKVTVQASFRQSAGAETPSTELPFQDVAAGSWYADAVAQAYEEGWMNGTSATAFSPNSEITRGMIVTILHRLEQTPAAEAASFTDVAAGSYYADAVAWAAANDIVKGYSERQFGPNDPITREQLATILYNYANHKGYETTASADLSGFGDASQISAYAQTALQWANGAGIINGMADNTLQPQGSATRAEAATMLVRFQSNIAQ